MCTFGGLRKCNNSILSFTLVIFLCDYVNISDTPDTALVAHKLKEFRAIYQFERHLEGSTYEAHHDACGGRDPDTKDVPLIRNSCAEIGFLRKEVLRTPCCLRSTTNQNTWWLKYSTSTAIHSSEVPSWPTAANKPVQVSTSHTQKFQPLTKPFILRKSNAVTIFYPRRCARTNGKIMMVWLTDLFCTLHGRVIRAR